jgi:hypothetical protein
MRLEADEEGAEPEAEAAIQPIREEPPPAIEKPPVTKKQKTSPKGK